MRIKHMTQDYLDQVLELKHISIIIYYSLLLENANETNRTFDVIKELAAQRSSNYDEVIKIIQVTAYLAHLKRKCNIKGRENLEQYNKVIKLIFTEVDLRHEEICELVASEKISEELERFILTSLYNDYIKFKYPLINKIINNKDRNHFIDCPMFGPQKDLSHIIISNLLDEGYGVVYVYPQNEFNKSLNDYSGLPTDKNLKVYGSDDWDVTETLSLPKNTVIVLMDIVFWNSVSILNEKLSELLNKFRVQIYTMSRDYKGRLFAPIDSGDLLREIYSSRSDKNKLSIGKPDNTSKNDTFIYHELFNPDI